MYSSSSSVLLVVDIKALSGQFIGGRGGQDIGQGPFLSGIVSYLMVEFGMWNRRG